MNPSPTSKAKANRGNPRPATRKEFMKVIHFTTVPAQRYIEGGQGFEQDGARLMVDVKMLFESREELRKWVARSKTFPREGEDFI